MTRSLLISLMSLAACHTDATGKPDETGDETGNDGGGPQLADALSVPLEQVSSFVVQTGASPDASTVFRAGEGPQLLALTLDGEVIEVSLLEGDGTGAHQTPPLSQIHSTPDWVLFSTFGFSVYEVAGEEEVEIPCNTIAARRSDSALFCSALGIRGSGDNWGNVDPGDATVLANASGDLMYFVSGDEFDQNIVYRVTSDAEGLVATLVEDVWRPNWLAVNGKGDLLVNHLPAGANEPLTEIHPADGGAPTPVPTTSPFIHNLSGISGAFGSPGEDVFYLLDLQVPPPTSSLLVAEDQGAGFVVTPHPVAVPMDGNNCGGLNHLVDGIYSVCGTTLMRLVEDEVVLQDPVLIPFEAATMLLSFMVRFADSLVVVVASDGVTNMFVRHDGITEESISFGDSIELLGFSVSRAGDINFTGVTIDTHEKVLGSVAADSTQLQILSSELVDPDAVVAFTRID
jgi:hypothetical protein